MKIEVRLENNKPILFFGDDPTSNPNFIACYTEQDGQNEAQRAYMRSLTKPRTGAESLECWQVLKRYAMQVKI